MSRLQRWRERSADFLFSDLIEQRVQNAVKVVDNKWWEQVGGATSRNDVPWWTRQDQLGTALEAWRSNPFARRIVAITNGFVLQNGIAFTSSNRDVQKFVNSFWNHRQNRMMHRLRKWNGALTMFGEVFPVLFLNAADGMSYVRSIPARWIDRVDTDPDDLEKEEQYHQMTSDAQGKSWNHVPQAGDARQIEMLHFAVNVPEGGVRGSGDLDPILDWMRRYNNFLRDRAAINHVKSRVVWDLQIDGADATEVERQKRAFLTSLEGDIGVFAHNDAVALKPLFAGIASDTTDTDSRAMRLMIATGANAALHHFGEGDSANRASATSSDRSMLSHYLTRRGEVLEFCAELIERAAMRAHAAGHLTVPKKGLGLVAQVEELTREDNLMLAQATNQIVSALTQAKAEGWIDDATAQGLVFKFAGEAAATPERDK